MARIAWFEDLVNSASRKLSTLLPWRFAVSITVSIVPNRLAPAFVRLPKVSFRRITKARTACSARLFVGAMPQWSRKVSHSL